ncbi:MAG TPA: Spy/CpxP family protein refolding chaperone [Gemmatimonadaceae bacterium]|nr:Spy/CpxP family protein refolding chaperone [Gemmatimonadaceae bacterium]
MNRILIAVACATLGAAPLAAQQSSQVAPGTDTSRARLEGQIRQRLARVVRQRVGLNDDQMNRLQQVESKYEQQRRPLALEERSARLTLRGQLVNEGSADQKQVDGLIAKLLDLQQRRIALVQQEQRDLSAFMTPVQRAKFLGLQEQLRKRVNQMRQRQGRGPEMRPRQFGKRRAP